MSCNRTRIRSLIQSFHFLSTISWTISWISDDAAGGDEEEEEEEEDEVSSEDDDTDSEDDSDDEEQITPANLEEMRLLSRNVWMFNLMHGQMGLNNG